MSLGAFIFVPSIVIAVVLTSCAEHTPRNQPREVFQKGENWKHAPFWASGSIQQNWWTSYRDSRLNSRIATALANNSDLRVLAARLERSRAQTRQAAAASWPSINLGTGLVSGNEAIRMTGFKSVDLEPWASSAAISWEIDLFGKIRAATNSAHQAEQAAFWDLHAGRLLVATQVAEDHFRLLRLNEEKSLVVESVAANRKIVETMRHRNQAGLISTTELRRQEAEHERLTRTILDLERLRGLANLQLSTLLGRATPSPPSAGTLQAVRTPPLPSRTTSAVLRHRPDLLAAEARVRSAFQLEKSSRLNLLPSLSLGAGASGQSSALAAGFRQWISSVGPRLDIPVYDPRRLAAVRVRRAETDEAAALYRSTALKAFEEVESSYLNLANRGRQLSAVRREVTALDEARQNTLALFEGGIVSQIELLESERRSLEGRRQELAVRHALLRDHLALVKALGGAQ